MNFKAIQDAVLSDRFQETQRGDCKNWINHRYAWLWGLEDWTFKSATAVVTVTAGSQAVTTLPTDISTVVALYRSNGDRLKYLMPVKFFELFYDTTNATTGTPYCFTIVNGQLFVGPTSNETAADYKLLYMREVTLLVNDGDTPGLPAGFHFALVHGGASEGLKLQNDFTWQFFEQDFQASIQAMSRAYLSDQDGDYQQYGADPLDGPQNWASADWGF